MQTIIPSSQQDRPAGSQRLAAAPQGHGAAAHEAFAAPAFATGAFQPASFFTPCDALSWPLRKSVCRPGRGRLKGLPLRGNGRLGPLEGATCSLLCSHSQVTMGDARALPGERPGPASEWRRADGGSFQGLRTCRGWSGMGSRGSCGRTWNPQPFGSAHLPKHLGLVSSSENGWGRIKQSSLCAP